MKTIKTYECFNERRYSNPWVAIVGEDGKINFKRKIGGYTGAYGKGEAGELYITEPVENAVYAYGQKDYRGSNTEYRYIQYRNGQFVPVEKTELVAVLNGAAPEAAAEMEAVEETSEPEEESVEEPAEEAAPETAVNEKLRMTCELYNNLVEEAVKDDDRDAYISDWSMSTAWGAPAPDAEWMQRIETLERIWDAVHLAPKDIRAATGLTQVRFALRFGMSCRAVQEWDSGRTECPIYVKLLLAQAVGLYQPPEVE